MHSIKNFPASNAKCCKQHAATAAAAKPKPKPVSARPAGFRTSTVAPFKKKNPLPVTKSTAFKPASAHQLQNDQVKKASDTNTTANVDTQKTKAQQLRDAVTGGGGDSGGGGDWGKGLYQMQ